MPRDLTRWDVYRQKRLCRSRCGEVDRPVSCAAANAITRAKLKKIQLAAEQAASPCHDRFVYGQLHRYIQRRTAAGHLDRCAGDLSPDRWFPRSKRSSRIPLDHRVRSLREIQECVQRLPHPPADECGHTQTRDRRDAPGPSATTHPSRIPSCDRDSRRHRRRTTGDPLTMSLPVRRPDMTGTT